jgi:hypothetical protein
MRGGHADRGAAGLDIRARQTGHAWPGLYPRAGRRSTRHERNPEPGFLAGELFPNAFGAGSATVVIILLAGIGTL